MALKCQCNFVSIMVLPEVSMKEKFSQKNRKTMFFYIFDGYFCYSFYKINDIYIGAIFSILKIIKEFQLDLMLERVYSFHTLGVQKYQDNGFKTVSEMSYHPFASLLNKLFSLQRRPQIKHVWQENIRHFLVFLPALKVELISISF